MGPLMRLTAFFAVLCAIFSVLEAHSARYLLVFGFIVVVGLAQVFTYSGHRPRRASIVVGIVPGLLLVILTWIVMWQVNSGRNPRPDVGSLFLVAAVVTVFQMAIAVLFGYLAGWVVVGILLGRELVPDAEPPAKAPDRADGPDTW